MGYPGSRFSSTPAGYLLITGVADAMYVASTMPFRKLRLPCRFCLEFHKSLTKGFRKKWQTFAVTLRKLSRPPKPRSEPGKRLSPQGGRQVTTEREFLANSTVIRFCVISGAGRLGPA